MTDQALHNPKRSIRSRLLFYMLAISSVAVLILAVVAASTTRRIASIAEESSSGALLAQAEDFLTRLNTSQARENDLLLEKTQEAGLNLAAYIAQVFSNPDVFKAGFWSVETHMRVGSDGQYSNAAADTTSVFVPNSMVVDETIFNEIEKTAYLDYVFSSAKLNAPNIEAVYFSTPNNVLRYYPNINLGEVLPPDFTPTERPWYIGATGQAAAGKPYWAPVYRDATGLGLITTFSVPVYGGENQLYGVLGLDITLGGIQKNIETSQILETGYSFLVAQDGSALAMPAQGYLDINVKPPEGGQANPNLRVLNTPFNSILDQLLSGKTGFHEVSTDGKEIYIAYTPLESTGWVLATVANKEEVLASVTELRSQIDRASMNLVVFQLLPISLAIFVGVLISGYILSNQLVRPIQRLAEVAQRLRRKEWNVEFPKVTDDEIGVLANSLQDMSFELQDIISSLEERVAQRTSELERRTAQVQVAAEIARDTSSLTASGEMESVQFLMERAINLIRERFGFYHAGIFLLDPKKEFAVIQAATGEAGRLLIEKGHKLKVGETGIVGYATGHGKPRISGDVTRDPNHFRNPLLPDTHSEMALPLRIGEQVIGALDVQSTELNAFSEDDVTILQTMADQLAVAIENARLLQNIQSNLVELERLYNQYERKAWEQTSHQQPVLGYSYGSSGLQPLPDSSIMQTSQEKEKLTEPITIPLEVRKVPIGSLEVWPQEEGFLPEDKEFLQEVGRRISQAMESARLFEESQARAYREETINRVANQVRSSINMETVLQNTVRELGKALGATRTFIQLGVPDENNRESDDPNVTKSNGKSAPPAGNRGQG